MCAKGATHQEAHNVGVPEGGQEGGLLQEWQGQGAGKRQSAQSIRAAPFPRSVSQLYRTRLLMRIEEAACEGTSLPCWCRSLIWSLSLPLPHPSEVVQHWV